VREVQGEQGNEIDMRLRDGMGGDARAERFDAVVLATGYRRDAHHALLDPLADALGKPVEQCEVARDYMLATPAHFQPRIYLQGCCEDSHGLSDTLLSILARRADEIAGSLEAGNTENSFEVQTRTGAQTGVSGGRVAFAL
jgi:L-ornithine N5-oxygenase